MSKGIYDHNGTTATQIKKIYDYNGTTATQIKKVYDYNGTTSTQVYASELVLFDGTSLASGYQLINSGTSGLFYARSTYGTSFAYVGVDLTNFSSIKITYSANCGTFGCVTIGFGTNKPTSGTTGNFEFNKNNFFHHYDTSGASKSEDATKTYNVASLTGMYYIGTYTYNTQYNTTDGTITRIVLE